MHSPCQPLHPPRKPAVTARRGPLSPFSSRSPLFSYILLPFSCAPLFSYILLPLTSGCAPHVDVDGLVSSQAAGKPNRESGLKDASSLRGERGTARRVGPQHIAPTAVVSHAARMRRRRRPVRALANCHSKALPRPFPSSWSLPPGLKRAAGAWTRMRLRTRLRPWSAGSAAAARRRPSQQRRSRMGDAGLLEMEFGGRTSVVSAVRLRVWSMVGRAHSHRARTPMLAFSALLSLYTLSPSISLTHRLTSWFAARACSFGCAWRRR